MPPSRVNLREVQAPLRERYRADPASAPVVLHVTGGTADLADPLHCAVEAGTEVIRSGAHAAVGGAGDVPCSGDLLLAALAACQETTLRMVAANLGIELESLEVTVEGDWDPRGTLAMGKEFPIGLTGIRCRTRVVVRGDERGERTERLLRSAEKYCVVLNTLHGGVPVESEFRVDHVQGASP